MVKSRSEDRSDSKKQKSAESIKSDLASLKLLGCGFHESNFMIANVKVKQLYLNKILDIETTLKVEAIEQYPRPETKSQVRQLLGLVQQFCLWCPIWHRPR